MILCAIKALPCTQLIDKVTIPATFAADQTARREWPRVRLAPLTAKGNPIGERLQQLVSLLVGQLSFLFRKPREIKIHPPNLIADKCYLLFFLDLFQVYKFPS